MAERRNYYVSYYFPPMEDGASYSEFVSMTEQDASDLVNLLVQSGFQEIDIVPVRHGVNLAGFLMTVRRQSSRFIAPEQGRKDWEPGDSE